MKKKPKVQLTGAFGKTQVWFDPQTRRAITVDVTNCPHCGVHHASAPVEMKDDRMIVRCPALGGRPITMTVKLFLHPV